MGPCLRTARGTKKQSPPPDAKSLCALGNHSDGKHNRAQLSDGRRVQQQHAARRYCPQGISNQRPSRPRGEATTALHRRPSSHSPQRNDTLKLRREAMRGTAVAGVC